MANYFKTLSPVEITNEPKRGASVMQKLPAGKKAAFKRIIRREGADWIKFTQEDGSLAYISHDPKKVAIAKEVKLGDAEVIGFNVKVKEPSNLPWYDHLTWVNAKTAPMADGHERVYLKRLEKGDDGKKELVYVDFDPKIVEVNTFHLKEDDSFYMYDLNSSELPGFVEIDDLNKRHGYVFASISQSSAFDTLVLGLGIVIALATVVGIMYACYQAGWLVFGKILILIGIGVAFVALILVGLITAILKGILQAIYKRI